MSDSTGDEIRAAQAARREARLGAAANQPDAGLSTEVAAPEKSKKSRFAKYDTEIDVGRGDMAVDGDDEGNASGAAPPRLLDSCTSTLPDTTCVHSWTDMLLITVTAPKHLLNEFADEDAEDPFAATAKSRQVAARQNEYHHRRFEREVGEEGESYADKMRRAEIEREELRVRREIERRQQEGVDSKGEPVKQLEAPDETPRRKRWDVAEPAGDVEMANAASSVGQERGGEWDESKLKGKEAAAAPAETPRRKRSRWDETPAGVTAAGGAPGETPKRSRWDQTPVGGVGATPVPGSLQPFGMTPTAAGTTTINTVQAGTAGEGFLLIGGVMDRRVRWLTDEELDQMLPSEGYEIVQPPAGYEPIRTPARKLQETPLADNGGFMMPEQGVSAEALGISTEMPTDIEGVGDLQFFKKEDAQYFAKVGFPLGWRVLEAGTVKR
jgi:splicing factor 3B subunit 1